MECPQCSAGLQATAYEGVPMHTCESCGGEFVGGEELGRIVDNRKATFDAGMKDELTDCKPSFGAVSSQPDRSLSCPACGHPMTVSNYAGDSGIFVDRCEVCSGLWLDHAELEKVQIIMERWADEAKPRIQALAGKLEQARRTAADNAAGSFRGSRFAFVNALINRLLDAA